jgi:hypothetical protein
MKSPVKLNCNDLVSPSAALSYFATFFEKFTDLHVIVSA